MVNGTTVWVKPLPALAGLAEVHLPIRPKAEHQLWVYQKLPSPWMKGALVKPGLEPQEPYHRPSRLPLGLIRQVTWLMGLSQLLACHLRWGWGRTAVRRGAGARARE